MSNMYTLDCKSIYTSIYPNAFSFFKRSRPWVVIGRFQYILFVSFLAVVVIAIDGSEQRNDCCHLGFELQSLRVTERRSNFKLVADV